MSLTGQRQAEDPDQVVMHRGAKLPAGPVAEGTVTLKQPLHSRSNVTGNLPSILRELHT